MLGNHPNKIVKRGKPVMADYYLSSNGKTRKTEGTLGLCVRNASKDHPYIVSAEDKLRIVGRWSPTVKKVVPSAEAREDEASIIQLNKP